MLAVGSRGPSGTKIAHGRQVCTWTRVQAPMTARVSSSPDSMTSPPSLRKMMTPHMVSMVRVKASHVDSLRADNPKEDRARMSGGPGVRCSRPVRRPGEPGRGSGEADRPSRRNRTVEASWGSVSIWSAAAGRRDLGAASSGGPSSAESSSDSPANQTPWPAGRDSSASTVSAGAASAASRASAAGLLAVSGSDGEEIAAGAAAAAAAAARVASTQPDQPAGAVRKRWMLSSSWRTETCRCTATAAAPASSQMAANVSGGAGDARSSRLACETDSGDCASDSWSYGRGAMAPTRTAGVRVAEDWATACA
eukprot:scaffold1647_cov102-Isochrysis_galbana.AAC.2